MDLGEFIHTYFVKPIETGEGYNIVNTITYALVLIAFIYAIKELLLKKLKVKIDKRLFYELLPYILLGGFVRVLEDTHALPRHFLFVTPGIHILIFIIAITVLIVSTKTKRGYFKQAGWLLCSLAAIALLYKLVFPAEGATPHVEFFLVVTIVAGIITLATYSIVKKYKPEYATPDNSMILFGHMLDATASTMAISFLGYYEQHVLPTFFMENFGTFSFIPLKLVLVLLALYIIETQSDDKEWKWMLKIAVLLLGLAPGLRNAARLLLGV
jgi:uncharacterized membrane protein